MDDEWQILQVLDGLAEEVNQHRYLQLSNHYLSVSVKVSSPKPCQACPKLGRKEVLHIMDPRPNYGELFFSTFLHRYRNPVLTFIAYGPDRDCAVNHFGRGRSVRIIHLVRYCPLFPFIGIGLQRLARFRLAERIPCGNT